MKRQSDPTPATLLAAYREQLVIVEDLEAAVERTSKALRGFQPELLAGPLSDQEKTLRRLGEVRANVTRLTAELEFGFDDWSDDERAELRDLRSRLTTAVERLWKLNSTNEAIASRSLLLTRHCLGLVAGSASSSDYAARGQRRSVRTTEPMVYSRRG